jgi:hybrid cluster-associated redox disulfide protein
MTVEAHRRDRFASTGRRAVSANGVWLTAWKESPVDNKDKLDVTQPIERITTDCLVQELVRRYPQTIAILARHGLQCAGCIISPFHTIADSAREYAVSIQPLLSELNRAIVSPADTFRLR